MSNDTNKYTSNKYASVSYVDARYIGNNVRTARNARGWTQTQLAEQAGISRATIARIERGSHISTATLEKIVAALGVQVLVAEAESVSD